MGQLPNENDYELLYLIYQMDDVSLEALLYKYRTLGQAQLHFYFSPAEISEYGEDYMAEVLMIIYKAIYAYRPDRQASFKTFYYHLFYHHVINYRRHFQTYRGRCEKTRLSLDRVIHDSDSALIEILANRDRSLEGISVLVREEQKERLKKFFYQLKPIERQAVWLYHQGYRYQEIMDRLGLEYRQIEYILTKARNHKH